MEIKRERINFSKEKNHDTNKIHEESLDILQVFNQ